jgi:citrate lyase subunit beta/citryl-CoA lyase
MNARSLLFVPGDSDRKIAKSSQSGADIVVLDLEDSVAAAQKAAARARVVDYLDTQRGRVSSQLWVRINPLDTPEALPDLVAVLAKAPDGIIQPKTRSPQDVIRLGYYLDALEQHNGLEPRRIKIIPVATETPEALFTLGAYATVGPRLCGLTWGAEDLSVALGALNNKDTAGQLTPPFELARSLCLCAAKAAAVSAIDTLFADFKDDQGLRNACAAGRRDGFTGKIAIHPEQVPVINDNFTPSAAEADRAQRIVMLFSQNPGTAALAFDGRMLDMPHLRQAESVLARYRAFSKTS